jgi:hypothetical protein
LGCGEVLLAELEGNSHPTVLLGRVSEIVNRAGWRADTLTAIASVLREAGFDVGEAEEDAT